MRTTSYDISKKLAEIGFEGDAVYYYRKDEPNQKWHLTELQFEGIDNHYPAYDLETILEALPKTLNSTEGTPYLNIEFILGGTVGYLNSSQIYLFECREEDNESLADTAAKLLLKLHKKGLVKFNN